MNMLDIFNFVGVPYKDRGRTFKGVDCYGLVYLFYRNFYSIELPEYTDIYSSSENVREAHKAFSDKRHELWKEVQKPSFGDVILFKRGGKLLSHVGIYIDDENFLHIQHGRSSCVERYIDFPRPVEGVYRYATL